MDALVILNTIQVIMWIAFFIYLTFNQKYVPINSLGLMLAVSAIYPYIIYHDTWGVDKEVMSQLHYEIFICRFLVLLMMYTIVRRAKVVNKQLTKLSKKDRNLLKPKK